MIAAFKLKTHLTSINSKLNSARLFPSLETVPMESGAGSLTEKINSSPFLNQNQENTGNATLSGEKASAPMELDASSVTQKWNGRPQPPY